MDRKLTPSVLRSESLQFLKDTLPSHWSCALASTHSRTTLRIGFLPHLALSEAFFFAHIASTQHCTHREAFVRHCLKTSTLHNLSLSLHVHLLVKYVASEQEAYWEFADACLPRTPETETTTVYLHGSNRLSRRPWIGVVDKVCALQRLIQSTAREQHERDAQQVYRDFPLSQRG